MPPDNLRSLTRTVTLKPHLTRDGHRCSGRHGTIVNVEPCTLVLTTIRALSRVRVWPDSRRLLVSIVPKQHFLTVDLTVMMRPRFMKSSRFTSLCVLETMQWESLA